MITVLHAVSIPSPALAQPAPKPPFSTWWRTVITPCVSTPVTRVAVVGGQNLRRALSAPQHEQAVVDVERLLLRETAGGGPAIRLSSLAAAQRSAALPGQDAEGAQAGAQASALAAALDVDIVVLFGPFSRQGEAITLALEGYTRSGRCGGPSPDITLQPGAARQELNLDRFLEQALEGMGAIKGDTPPVRLCPVRVPADLNPACGRELTTRLRATAVRLATRSDASVLLGRKPQLRDETAEACSGPAQGGTITARLTVATNGPRRLAVDIQDGEATMASAVEEVVDLPPECAPARLALAEVLRAQLPQLRPSAAEVEVRPARATFRVGEPVDIRLRLAADRRLFCLNVTADDTALMLLPAPTGVRDGQIVLSQMPALPAGVHRYPADFGWEALFQRPQRDLVTCFTSAREPTARLLQVWRGGWCRSSTGGLMPRTLDREQVLTLLEAFTDAGITLAAAAPLIVTGPATAAPPGPVCVD